MAEKEYILRTEILEMLDERLAEKDRSLKNATDSINIYGTKHDINQLNFVMTCVKVFLVDIPSADVEPVKHAEWKFGELCGQEGWYCTHCGAGYSSQKHGTEAELIAKSCDYCPKCGAKMDGKDKTNDEL